MEKTSKLIKHMTNTESQKDQYANDTHTHTQEDNYNGSQRLIELHRVYLSACGSNLKKEKRKCE